MAKNNNLGDFLTDIADAIRTKKGTSETINAQNFSTEIINLPSGSNTLKTFLDNTKTCSSLFGNYTGNNIADLIQYSDTENVTNMMYMFNNCTNITSIPSLDTGNVTNMSSMFYNCSNITSIPLLNTSSVTNMNYMFNSCTNLTTISALDTSSVTTMSNMFNICRALTAIPLLNTSNVTNMTSMFSGCTNLTTIPALNTSNVTSASSMFQNCSQLTTISALDMSKITSMYNMFYNCSSLTHFRAYGMKVNFDISASTLLPASELEIIFGNLADLTGQTQRTITIGATNKAKLTAEQIAIATAKNWVVA